MLSRTRSSTHTLTFTYIGRPVFSHDCLPPMYSTLSTLPTLMPETLTGAPGWTLPLNS